MCGGQSSPSHSVENLGRWKNTGAARQDSLAQGRFPNLPNDPEPSEDARILRSKTPTPVRPISRSAGALGVGGKASSSQVRLGCRPESRK